MPAIQSPPRWEGRRVLPRQDARGYDEAWAAWRRLEHRRRRDELLAGIERNRLPFERPWWYRWAIDAAGAALWAAVVLMVASGQWWIVPAAGIHLAIIGAWAGHR